MDNEAIEATAAEWVIRRSGDDWTDSAQQKLDSWLSESTFHRIAYLQLDAVWQQTARLKALAAGLPAGAVPPVGTWSTGQRWSPSGSADGSATPAPARKRWIGVATSVTRPITAGLAASLLVSVCLVWYALSRPQLFQTKVGEQHSVMLADGSRITLNTASKIEVRLEADRRVIDLVKGEALFEVAHDVRRPFDVHAGNAVVRAVGTQFDIDRRATRTVVTVTEGRVAMIAAAARNEKLPVLSEADRVVIDSTGAGTLQHGVNLAETTAWIQHELVFHRRPLGEIAEEFNRYNSRRIQILSSALQQQEVTGTFRSDDVASFVAVLAGIPGVHVVDDGAGGYNVTWAESAAPLK